MPSVDVLRAKGLEPEREIKRNQKGTLLSFFPDIVVKSYDHVPTLLSLEERNRRFQSELNAYVRFKEMRCLFVPELLDFSEEEHWICTKRIRGEDLFSITQKKSKSNLSIKDWLDQIKQMHLWLKSRKVVGLGTNLKDLILGNDGQLYLIDFEMFDRSKTADKDIYDSLVGDILQRLFIRKGRSARLTPSFLRLSSAIMLSKPRKVSDQFGPVVIGQFADNFKRFREATKQAIKRTFHFSL